MMECNDCFRWKLAQQIERGKEEQPRAKETMAALARKDRPKSQNEIKETVVLCAAARSLLYRKAAKKCPLLTGANAAVFINSSQYERGRPQFS
jgi:hypothetical protein